MFVVYIDNVEVHWSEDDMTLALESVKTGNMSINQVRNAQTSQVSLFLRNKLGPAVPEVKTSGNSCGFSL